MIFLVCLVAVLVLGVVWRECYVANVDPILPWILTIVSILLIVVLVS